MAAQDAATRPVSAFRFPRWTGEDLDGKTIVLHWEQGLGDTLQFIRFAPQVAERGGRVVVFCQTPLSRLVARCDGVDLSSMEADPFRRSTSMPPS